MTKSQLPEITLTCGNGHRFTTSAAGGQTVRCKVKVCGKSKHVPMNRPRTAREAASYTAPSSIGDDHQDPEPVAEPDPGAELADRWQSEAEWSGSITVAPDRDSRECPECEGPLSWEPRRTLVCCPKCKRLDLPPAVFEHYERQQGQRTQVAIRQQADPVAEKAARARLRALIIQAEQWASTWLETIGDPESYDRVQWQRSAQEFSATLRGWMPELKSAGSESELSAIKAIIVSELLNSEPGKELRAEYEAAINRAEQAKLRRQYAEEMAEREAEEEAERRQQQKELEAKQRELRKPATPRAITSGTKSAITPTVADLIIQARLQKERALAKRGECAFKHTFGTKPADRLYWVPQRSRWGGEDTGYAIANTPQMRACSKHFAALEAEMDRQGYPDIVWRDLNAS